MPKDIRIKSWNQLVDFLNKIPPVDIACRGEEKKYPKMKSKIDRCLDLPGLRSRLRMERAVCQRFREHAPIYLSPVEHQYLETRWLELVVMQHYGAPTRLLDWTKSPWVAAFFAVSSDWDSHGYVYGFRRDKLENRIKTKFGKDLKSLVWGPNKSDMKFPDNNWDQARSNDILFDPVKVKRLSEWIATYYCRVGHFTRLIAQQGIFTFGSKPGLDHWQQISSLLPNDDCFVIQIDRHAKLDILRKLNGIGLNGATLFPGPDGIGRYMEGFSRVWHLNPRPSQF
jgi:hypothetical protein